jgi:molybdate transport system ATP-binding protein
VICLKECRVFGQGHRSKILAKDNLKRLFDRRTAVKVPDQKKPVPISVKGLGKGATVIKVKDACIRYDELSVFAHLNWTVRKGENWAVIGPNGSGKTALLHLISADHPQAYANEIYLFGRRRGSGESIWEIKNHMGVVSTEFQVNYRKPVKVLEVVLSGFFNSIGLYRQASSEQRNMARKWIERLNLSHLADKRFDHLSYGERRRILIARALVKSPEILMLDEPCQGLDPMNRQGVLDLIDDICNKTPTQLLYVTHHLNEIPNCVTHILDLETQAYKILRRSRIK